MSAARDSFRALFGALDEVSTAELDRRLDAHAAEVRRGDADRLRDERKQYRGRDRFCGGIEHAARLLKQWAEKTTTPAEAAPELTIYRASHDSIAMGLYTTAAAAREHCEAEERHSWGKGDPPSFDWIEDEEDGVAELTVWVRGEECATGYEVTAIEVASAYDKEAGE